MEKMKIMIKGYFSKDIEMTKTQDKKRCSNIKLIIQKDTQLTRMFISFKAAFTMVRI